MDIITILKKFCSKSGVKWRSPLIHHPHPDNAFCTIYEWWNDELKLTIYVPYENKPNFIKVWDANIWTGMEDGILTCPTDLETLWRWFDVGKAQPEVSA